MKLFSLLCLFVFPTLLLSTTISWNGAVDDNWHVPGNWSTGSVPGITDDVIIAINSTVTIQDGIASANSILMTNGTLIIGGGRSLNIDAGGSATIGFDIDGGTLHNSGTINFSGIINANGLRNEGIVNNNSGAVIKFSGHNGAAPLFNREMGVINNSGQINLLNCGEGVNNQGLLNILSIGSVAVIGLTAGSALVNGHAINVENATIDNAGTILISNAVNGITNYGDIICQTTAVLSISGITTGHGINNSSAEGNFTNYGHMTLSDIQQNAILNVAEASFVNYDTIIIDSVHQALRFGIQNEAVFTNNPGGYLSISDVTDQGIRNQKEGSDFENNGEIVLSNTGGWAFSTFWSSFFRNRGTITADTICGISTGFDGVVTTTYTGEGTLNAPAVNINADLYIELTPAILEINGNLEFEGFAHTTLNIHGVLGAGNNSGHDQIQVSGELLLGGTLEIDNNGAFTPTAGSFTLLTYTGSLNSVFDALILPAGWTGWVLDYTTPGQVNLKKSPCGGLNVVNAFIALSGDWDTPSNWSLGHVPLPCEDVEIIGVFNDPNPKSATVSSASAVAKSVKVWHTYLTIQSSATLIIDPNLSSKQGLSIIGRTVTNNGTLQIENIIGQDGIAINGEGMLENFGDIIVDNISGPSANAMSNQSSVINHTSGTIQVSNNTTSN